MQSIVPPAPTSRISKKLALIFSVFLFLVEIAVFYIAMIIKAWEEFPDFDYRDHLVFLAGILVACGFNYLFLRFGISKIVARKWLVGQFIIFVILWIGLTYLFLGQF